MVRKIYFHKHGFSVNKSICISTLLLLILLGGCSNPQAQELLINPQNCIYYKGTKGLYAEDTKNGVKKLLVEGDIEYKDKVSSHIFYINNENGQLGSFDTETEKTIEYDTDFSTYVNGKRYYSSSASEAYEEIPLSIFIKASGEYIYYGVISKEDASAISWEFVYTRYRMKFDGTELSTLNADYVHHLATNDRKVYYNRIQTINDKKVYRLFESDFDGTNEKFLLDNGMHDVKVIADENYLYYNTREDENGNVIKRMNIATQELEIIAKTGESRNEKICAIYGNNLYVRNASGEVSSVDKTTFKRNYVFADEAVLAIPEKFMIAVRDGYIYLNSDDENYRRELFEDNTVGILEAI